MSYFFFFFDFSSLTHHLSIYIVTTSSIVDTDGSDWSLFLGGVADLRGGGSPVDDFRSGAVTMEGANAKKVRKELGKIARTCVAKSEEAQLQFVKEIGQTW